jgi:hypothetical protein
MMMSPNLIQHSKSAGTARRALLAGLAAIAIALPTSPAAGGVVSIEFDADNFDNPLDIDNTFLPMAEGTTQIYKAEGADGCEVNVVTVTSRKKRITIEGESIQARVVEDLAYEDPECDGFALILVEKTFDWFAQDDAGNVWYFGEETFDCEGAGSCELGEGSWEAGKDVADVGTIAEPGLIMLANPRNGDQYYQEFYEGFAEDQARVTGVGVTVTLEREDAWPGSPFTGCLKTKEWTQLDPGAVEQKYYCPGIGLVAVDEHHGKELRFELVMSAASAASDAFDFRRVPGTR